MATTEITVKTGTVRRMTPPRSRPQDEVWFECHECERQWGEPGQNTLAPRVPQVCPYCEARAVAIQEAEADEAMRMQQQAKSGTVSTVEGTKWHRQVMRSEWRKLTAQDPNEGLVREYRVWPANNPAHVLVLRVTVLRNSYEFQSKGVCEVFSPTTLAWNVLTTKHYAELKCNERSPYAQDPDDMFAMRELLCEDHDALIEQAFRILSAAGADR